MNVCPRCRENLPSFAFESERDFCWRCRLKVATPTMKVNIAIRLGCETQEEIAELSRLPKDEVGECIAQALLYDYTIRTEVIDGVRKYFMNERGQIRRKPVRPVEPKSYGVSSIYFAA